MFQNNLNFIRLYFISLILLVILIPILFVPILDNMDHVTFSYIDSSEYWNGNLSPTFLWPIPGYSRISSNFGYRTPPASRCF